jgi:hypothetical protein
MDQQLRLAVRHFHNTVSSADEVQIQRHRPSAHAHQPFRPLPPPTGAYPYHLSLADVLPPNKINADRLVFHMVGDTGGIKNPLPQRNVARQMESDFDGADSHAQPAFFYHLGDVVYFFGAAEEYFPQLYEPYEQYPAPIFAIPGNHDGDLSRRMEADGIPSLAAFVDNFCQRIPHHTRDALDAMRSAMTEPNVYWTLDTPVATLIGLYTNVPEGGRLDDDQIAWLEQELAHAPKERALLVAMHHPIYSGDDHHGGSAYMGTILDEAMTRSNRTPDAVFAGHVHNYQRFTRQVNDRAVPYIVAGAGGYHNLHPLSRNMQAFAAELPAVVPTADDVTLEKYCDTLFGYLRLEITRSKLIGDYYTVPGFQDSPSVTTTHFDSFTFDLATVNPPQHRAPAPPECNS